VIALASSRIAMFVLVLLAVSAMTLLFLDLAPGDPAVNALGAQATPEQLSEYRHTLGLDQSFGARYVDFVKGLATLNFGRSIQTGQEVSDAISEAAPITIEIAALGFMLSVLIAVPLGLYTGFKQGGWLDRVVLFVASIVYSTPVFLIAIVLVYLFAVRNRILPVQGWVPLTDDPGENLRHAILPAIALSLPIALGWTRLLRNDVVATLDEDHVAAAYAQGLTTRRVMFKYVLRPSMFTLVTVMGIGVGQLLGGTVLIERIYGLPGLGTLAFTAVQNKDYTVIRAVLLLFAITFVVVNAIVDLTYPLLDPRVRS
jgi:peptide/nickel transport system permease protein